MLEWWYLGVPSLRWMTDASSKCKPATSLTCPRATTVGSLATSLMYRCIFSAPMTTLVKVELSNGTFIPRGRNDLIEFRGSDTWASLSLRGPFPALRSACRFT
jgi:hypothetical protein